MVIYQTETFVMENSKEIVFRNLNSEDVGLYIPFSDQIASETCHTLHYKGQVISINDLRDKFEFSYNSPWHLELGGFDENILISHLSFYIQRPNHPFELHIGEFGMKILKKYCSIGIGTKMLWAMENIARKMNVTRIQARVRTSNFLAINFYQKHNYEIEGLKKQAVFIDGAYQNEFYIAKILD